jgi:sugar transferase (PEP-CTERM/EpsH1 system associated)
VFHQSYQQLTVLFLTQRIPWPPIKGEKIRPGAVMRHFAQKHRVYLATLVDDPADLQYRETVRAQVHDASIHYLPKTVSYLQACIGFLFGRPLSFSFFYHMRLAAWVRRTIKQTKPDVIFVCSSNMVQFLGEPTPEIRTIMDFADVDSLKWENYTERARGVWRWIYAREARKVLAEEIAIAKWVKACTFVTEDEANLFRQVVPSAAHKTLALPSGVDSEFFSPEFAGESPFEGASPTYTFTGTMDYLPNEDAVTWFALEVLPIIQKTYPSARFYIVGSKPSQAVQRLTARPGVFVTHRVPDVRPYLVDCTAAVAPLRIARGIQNKVLEALAMGRPTVVTSGALTGIDAVPGTHVLLADTAETFAEACIELVTNATLSQDLGRAARKLIDEAYSWPARLAAFDALLEPADRKTAAGSLMEQPS